MSKPFNIGIAGSSKVTRLHIDAINQCSDFSLKCITGSYRPSLDEISAKYELKQVLDLDAFLESDIQLAVVTTKTESHFHYLQRIIPVVPNVIVEKPLTDSLSDAKSVIELAQQHGCNLKVVYQNRFDENYLLLKNTIQREDGPVSVRIDVRKNRGKVDFENTSSCCKDLIYTQFPHYLDLLMDLFGTDFNQIDAQFTNLQKISPFDDHLRVFLSKSGVAADVSITSCNSTNLPVRMDFYFRDFYINTLNFKVVYDSRKHEYRNLLTGLRRPKKNSRKCFLAMYKHYIADFLSNKSNSGELENIFCAMEIIDNVKSGLSKATT
jgi:predicted dehydrogenase